MEQLHALAQAAGVAREWTDVDGRQQIVADDALAAVLTALGHEAGSARQMARSLAAVGQRRAALPPMLVADCGASIPCPSPPPAPRQPVKTAAPARWRLMVIG